MQNFKSIIEGILFIWGEPIELKEISKALSLSESAAEDILRELIDDYSKEESGLRIIKRDNNYQMSTKPEVYSHIKEFVTTQKKKNLSAAALETLSIIAYKQPVIKSEIEELRGVKCDHIISNLAESGLIEEKGRLDRPGRPIIYGTTNLFLRKFGIESLDSLPEVEKLEESDIENITFLKE